MELINKGESSDIKTILHLSNSDSHHFNLHYISGSWSVAQTQCKGAKQNKTKPKKHGSTVPKQQRKRFIEHLVSVAVNTVNSGVYLVSHWLFFNFGTICSADMAMLR